MHKNNKFKCNFKLKTYVLIRDIYIINMEKKIFVTGGKYVFERTEQPRCSNLHGLNMPMNYTKIYM